MKKIVSILLVSTVLLLTLTQCTKRKCKENNNTCYCTKEYDPVCGCNGKTYGNACEAECKGITDYKKGSCK